MPANQRAAPAAVPHRPGFKPETDVPKATSSKRCKSLVGPLWRANVTGGPWDFVGCLGLSPGHRCGKHVLVPSLTPITGPGHQSFCLG